MRNFVIPLIAALALAGCESETDETLPSPAASAESRTASPSGDPAPEARSAPQIALDSEGLRVVDPRGSTRLVAFGAPRERIERAVGASIEGEPVRRALGECGAGPMQFTDYGPLKLHFQDDKFVGWFLGGDAGLTTMDGLGPGSSRSEVEEARVVTPIPGSTLGEEFTFGSREEAGIGGFFDGESKGARVESLFAGTTCFFR